MDVFRLNFSHGSAEDHAVRMAILREIEAETGRPIGVMADLQGPKLRVGAFAQGRCNCSPASASAWTWTRAPATPSASACPTRDLRRAGAGAELLLDDGRLRLRVDACVVWGVHSVHVDDVADIAQSTRLACAVATQERFCSAGQTLAIIAGMPFGKAGTTNLLRIATA